MRGKQAIVIVLGAVLGAFLVVITLRLLGMQNIVKTIEPSLGAWQDAAIGFVAAPGRGGRSQAMTAGRAR